ncbi:MAG: Wzz/FepE/Etk N-terminal domain-containing protein [Bacteroides sp.]
MNEEEKIKTSTQGEEQEIDLIALAQKVWAGRMLVLKCCGVALLIGLVVAFSIPKEYVTSVTLAPESKGQSGSDGGMGALAAMAGFNIGSSGRGGDALSPKLYPDIVNSTPFLTGLFDVKVMDQKAKLNTTVYDYLSNHQRGPWWGAITSAPFKALGWVVTLFKDVPKNEKGEIKLDPFRLTAAETGAAAALGQRISVDVDKKSGVTTLTVTMQDPLISATLTDTVMRKLQNYITDYRTTKARNDLAFTEKLYQEAKANYYEAQQKYASFADGNQNIILNRFRSEQERLQNEMNLSFGVYNQVAQQLQIAKAKVQEITPIYTVVQPATVPLKPAKPNKIMILIGFIFLAGVGSVGWLLFVKDLLDGWKKPSRKETNVLLCNDKIN